MLAAKNFDSSSYPFPTNFLPIVGNIGMPWHKAGFLSGVNIARNSANDNLVVDEKPSMRKLELSLEGIIAVDEFLMADEGLARSVVAASWNHQGNQNLYLPFVIYQTQTGKLEVASSSILFSGTLNILPYIFIETAFENKADANLAINERTIPFLDLRNVDSARDTRVIFEEFSSGFYGRHVQYAKHYAQKDAITRKYNNEVNHILSISTRIIQYFRQIYDRILQGVPSLEPLQNYNSPKLPDFNLTSEQSTLKIAEPNPSHAPDFKPYMTFGFVIFGDYAPKSAEMPRLSEISMQDFAQLKFDYTIFSAKIQPANGNYQINSQQMPALKIDGIKIEAHDFKQPFYDVTLVAKILGEKTNQALFIPELQKSYADRAANDNPKSYDNLQHDLEYLITDKQGKIEFRAENRAVANYTLNRNLDNVVQNEFPNGNYKPAPTPFVDDDGRVVNGVYVAVNKTIGEQDLQGLDLSSRNYLDVSVKLLNEVGYDVEVVFAITKDIETGKMVGGYIIINKKDPKKYFEILSYDPKFNPRGRLNQVRTMLGDSLVIHEREGDVGYINSSLYNRYGKSGSQHEAVILERVDLKGYRGEDYIDVVRGTDAGKNLSRPQIKSLFELGKLYISGQKTKNYPGGVPISNIEDKVNPIFVSAVVSFRRDYNALENRKAA